MKALKLFIFAAVVLLILSVAAGAKVSKDSKYDSKYDIAANKTLIINFNYKDRILKINSIDTAKGFVPEFMDSGTAKVLGLEKATLRLYSKKNELLYATEFYIENKKITDTMNEATKELGGGVVEYNDANFSIVAPYPSGMYKIEVFSANNKIVLEKPEIKAIAVASAGQAELVEAPAPMMTFIKVAETLDKLNSYIAV